MTAPNAKTEDTISIRKVFPALPEERIAEAESCVRRYVALVYRIYESIREDPVQYAAFQRRLTQLASDDSMDATGERPSTNSPSA